MENNVVEYNAQDLASIMNDASMDAFVPQMIRVKINHNEASFSMEGQPSVKRMSGIVITGKKSRVFFSSFGSQEINDIISKWTEKRPICSSDGCVKGNLIEADIDEAPASVKPQIEMIKQQISSGGLICSQCPLSKFGSIKQFGKEGRGQACNEMRRLLFIKVDGGEVMPIPMLLSVPPTSIRNWDGYCSTLMTQQKKFNAVITELSAVPQEAGSRKWASAQFSYIKDLDNNINNKLMTPVVQDGVTKPMIKALLDLFIRKDIEVEDYISDTDDSGF